MWMRVSVEPAERPHGCTRRKRLGCDWAGGKAVKRRNKNQPLPLDGKPRSSWMLRMRRGARLWQGWLLVAVDLPLQNHSIILTFLNGNSLPCGALDVRFSALIPSDTASTLAGHHDTQKKRNEKKQYALEQPWPWTQ